MSTPPQPARRSIRLTNYDYRTPGVYFFTICAWSRREIFGKIAGDKLDLTSAGEIVWKCWRELPSHYPLIQLDFFVVMPNHVYGLIVIHRQSPDRAGLRPAPTAAAPEMSETHHVPVGGKVPSWANVIGSLKSFSARRINQVWRDSKVPV